MKRCSSCNVEFNISDKYCPLCQNILTGECEDIMFPKNIRRKTNSIIIKILLFASIVILLVSGFIELMTIKELKYSYYIGLGLITNFIVVFYILKDYRNMSKILGAYGFIIISLLLIWYAFTKVKIITDYIIPSVCLFELLFNTIMSIILRKNYMVKYSGQIVLNAFLLLVPILLVELDLTSNNLMSYICCLLSIIYIVGLLIFFSDDIKEEFRKIFNV